MINMIKGQPLHVHFLKAFNKFWQEHEEISNTIVFHIYFCFQGE